MGQNARGIKSIVSGAILIGIGVVIGGSTVLGSASVFDLCFDGLGVLMIGRGVFSLATPAVG